ncbi:MAG: Rho termination factor N-terminal domain-containing protein [Clostridia bacterium]
MEIKIKLKDLDVLTIHELRDLARDVGVYNPTIMTKQELMENIGELLRGIESKRKKSGKCEQTNGFEEVFANTLSGMLIIANQRREEELARMSGNDNKSESFLGNYNDEEKKALSTRKGKGDKLLVVDPRIDTEVAGIFNFEKESEFSFASKKKENVILDDTGFLTAASSSEHYDTGFLESKINSISDVVGKGNSNTLCDSINNKDEFLNFSFIDKEKVDFDAKRKEDAEFAEFIKVNESAETEDKSVYIKDEDEDDEAYLDSEFVNNKASCVRKCRVVKLNNELIIRKQPFLRCVTDRKATPEEIEKFNLQYGDGVKCNFYYSMNNEKFFTGKILSSCRTNHPKSRHRFDLDIKIPKSNKEQDDWQYLVELEEDDDI